MTRLHHAWVLAAALGSLAGVGAGGDPPVRFPDPPAPPPGPSPAPAPRPVDPPGPPRPTELTADSVYVIDSDVRLVVVSSPRGKIVVTEDEGPVRVRGRFVDGDGRTETRTYKGKFVYTVEAVPGASGAVDLIVFPEGSKTQADVIWRQLMVRAGVGPLPPPKPDPVVPDPPKPDPKPDPVTTAPFPCPDGGLRVLMVFERANSTKLSPGHHAAIFGVPSRTYLRSVCAGGENGFRIYDPDDDVTNDDPVWKPAMAVKRDSLPWLVVSNGRTGYSGPLPADPAGLRTEVSKHEVKK